MLKKCYLNVLKMCIVDLCFLKSGKSAWEVKSQNIVTHFTWPLRTMNRHWTVYASINIIAINHTMCIYQFCATKRWFIQNIRRETHLIWKRADSWNIRWLIDSCCVCKQGMGSANERRRYDVTSSLIGWTHIQNNHLKHHQWTLS